MEDKKKKAAYLYRPELTVHSERRRGIWYLYWNDEDEGYQCLTGYDLRTLRAIVDKRLRRKYGTRSKETRFRFPEPVMHFGHHSIKLNWKDFQ